MTCRLHKNVIYLRQLNFVFTFTLKQTTQTYFAHIEIVHVGMRPLLGDMGLFLPNPVLQQNNHNSAFLNRQCLRMSSHQPNIQGPHLKYAEITEHHNQRGITYYYVRILDFSFTYQLLGRYIFQLSFCHTWPLLSLSPHCQNTERWKSHNCSGPDHLVL